MDLLVHLLVLLLILLLHSILFFFFFSCERRLTNQERAVSVYFFRRVRDVAPLCAFSSFRTSAYCDGSVTEQSREDQTVVSSSLCPSLPFTFLSSSPFLSLATSPSRSPSMAA